MANSSFYHWVQPGAKNGGNTAMLNAVEKDTLPWALTPELVFGQVVTWKDLRDATGVQQGDDLVVGGTIVAGDHEITFTNARTGAALVTLSYPVHEDTITIGGTAADGNYDAIFDSVGVRARVVRSTTPATNDDIAAALSDAIEDLIATDLAGIVASVSATDNIVTIVYEEGIAAQTITTAETTATGTITASVADDADAVAAGLEALIEAARDTDEPLEDYVGDESVTADTVSIIYVAGTQVALTVDFPGTSTGTVAVTNTATIAIGTTGHLFPANVWVAGDAGAGANVTTAFDGVTTLAAAMGDEGASDGLLTTADLLTAGFYSTIAATEYVEHFEIAYAPIISITSDGLFTDLTAGAVEFLIPFSAPPTI